MISEQWTADTWREIAIGFDAASANKSLPAKLRRALAARAEAAWITADWLRGVSPTMWEEECRIYQAEDAAMEKRNAALSMPAAKLDKQPQLAMAY